MLYLIQCVYFWPLFLQENPNNWRTKWCNSYKKTWTWAMRTTSLHSSGFCLCNKYMFSVVGLFFQMAHCLSTGLPHMYNKYMHDALTKPGTPSAAVNYPHFVILFTSVCCGFLESVIFLLLAWKLSTINISEDCLSCFLTVTLFQRHIKKLAIQKLVK